MKMKNDDQAAKALYDTALIYVDLAYIKRIERIRDMLAKRSTDYLIKLGTFRLTDNFLLNGINVEKKYMDAAAGLFECYCRGYAEIFGITNISKVPGKKIRVVLDVDAEKYKQIRLYYHPTPMWHAETRYEMTDTKYLTVAGGRRLISGFGHELGHMVVMWGKHRVREDDFHAWGPYCGFTLGDYVFDKLGKKAWPDYIPDYKRTDGTRYLKSKAADKPSCADYEGCLKLFMVIGDTLGTQIYGKAFAWMAKYNRTRKINNVRYYWMKDLKDALNALTNKKYSKWLDQIFADMYVPGK